MLWSSRPAYRALLSINLAAWRRRASAPPAAYPTYWVGRHHHQRNASRSTTPMVRRNATRNVVPARRAGGSTPGAWPGPTLSDAAAFAESPTSSQQFVLSALLRRRGSGADHPAVGVHRCRPVGVGPSSRDCAASLSEPRRATSSPVVDREACRRPSAGLVVQSLKRTGTDGAGTIRRSRRRVWSSHTTGGSRSTSAGLWAEHDLFLG
jgi:hypothetical protein